ncbi:hypothetical protein DFJ58DRAFT_236877 [Suillus subalutaceus]|uniref:uncharacterized protein n=1 Tax=Suillus subalutaceus TaxID=48586 RepID=UPI001B860F00|nr:uncharacterized protein DFJ58DRAFT_236877 [Suillus subalutaceus]KAG1832331.1 hypothetical protein DFJ58DRAFT_236877 [Suillus subalutaceus]
MEAQAFFSVPHELPVVVIFTGLDEFVRIELQKISDSESDVPQADEEETEEEDPEEQAMSRAMERFGTQYKHKLMIMQYPPKEVVALSEPHKSDPKDSRFSGLVAATLECLRVIGEVPKDDPRRRVETLFIAAQMADVRPKRHLSLS